MAHPRSRPYVPRARAPLSWVIPGVFVGLAFVVACAPNADAGDSAELERAVAAMHEATARLDDAAVKLEEATRELKSANAGCEDIASSIRDASKLMLGGGLSDSLLPSDREPRDPFADTNRGGDDASPDPFGLAGDERRNSRAIPGAAEAIRCEHLSCQVERRFLDAVLANPAALTRQARVVPTVRDGESRGFKLYGIRPGTLPKLLGFKNGDLIRSVNGVPISSLDKVMELYSSLRGVDHLELEVERRDATATFTIDIVESIQRDAQDDAQDDAANAE